MRRHAAGTVGLAALALVLAGCGGDTGTSAENQAADPETVTETVTETAEPADPETVTVTPEPDGGEQSASDACAELEGGEELAFIFVETPYVGEAVESGFEVSGCSNTFEAAYEWELLDQQGEQLVEDFGTADCGTGCVGDFEFTVDYEVDDRQAGTLRVFTSSAQDGSEQSVNAIPVVLEP